MANNEWYEKYTVKQLEIAYDDIEYIVSEYSDEFAFDVSEAAYFMITEVLQSYIKSVSRYHQAKPIQKAHYDLFVRNMKAHHASLYGEGNCKCGYCKND